MGALGQLVRPPAHRGPLIASGALLLAIGVVLFELRLGEEVGRGWHTALALATAALVLWLALQERPEGGAPTGHQSVMLVAGLLLAYLGLLRFADLVQRFDGDFPSGSFVWTSLVVVGLALYGAGPRGSSICALIAAIAGSVATLAAANWIFGVTSLNTFRWLLLLLALVFIVISLGLRGGSPRHSEQMVNAAGLAVLWIGLTAAFFALFGIFSFDGGPNLSLLPNGWEFVLFAAGCGLVAYAAVDKAPGPAYLGFANLGLFAVFVGTSDGNLKWWPAFVLALGLGVLLAGLRPLRPLPPEPTGYGAKDLPLAARSADEDVSVRVVKD